MLCRGGGGCWSEHPGRAEKLEGLRRVAPKVQRASHTVCRTQGSEGKAVFHQVLDSFRCSTTETARGVHGLVDPVLVGEQRWVVTTSQPGQVDSGFPRKLSLGVRGQWGRLTQDRVRGDTRQVLSDKLFVDPGFNGASRWYRGESVHQFTTMCGRCFMEASGGGVWVM